MMDIKTKQVDDFDFKNIIQKSIFNIKDSTTYYCDSLYAYCPKQQKFTQWIGLCMHCFITHGHQKKQKSLRKTRSVRIDNQYIEIKGSMFYEMIDIVVLENHLSFKLDAMMNKIQKEYSIENVRQVQQFIVEQLKQLEKIVDEQLKINNILSWCQKQQLQELDQVKYFVLRCQKNFGNWLGYCGFCRKEEKHRIMIKYSKENENNKKGNNGVQDIGTIKCDEYSDYRLIDTYEFHSQLRNYFKETILELFERKTVEEVQTQSNTNVGLQQKQQIIKENENQLLEEEKKIVQINEKYKQQIIENEKQIQTARLQNQKLQEMNEKQADELLYDIQINCEQLLDLTTEIGWKVLKNEFYDKMKENQTIVVSFYGLYNKGKSFIAQKLSGKQILTGYSVSTIGLSAIYPRDIKSENSIVFLDTAGLETPIHHHRKDAIYQKFSLQQDEENDDTIFSKIYEAKLRDRLLTENLIQQFVLNQSHLILIIVDQLSKEEQKLIKRIRTKYQQSELVIVHNFSKLSRLEEVKNYIQIDIINSFENIELQYRKMTNTLSGYVYIEERQGDKGQQLSPITHVVMAKEYSKAGEEYNSFCYKYLESRMVSIFQFKKFDIIKCLMAEVQKEIVNLFKLNSEQKTHQYILKYDENKNAITANLENTELKSISFDMLGDMQVYNEDESPKYNYIVINEQLILNLELYGKFEPQKEDQEEKFKKFICKCEDSGSSLLEWHGFRNNQDQFIQLRAQYQGPISKQLQKPDNSGDPEQQRINKFQLVVPISPIVCVLKPSRPNFSFKQGIARFEFSIQKNNSLQE